MLYTEEESPLYHATMSPEAAPTCPAHILMCKWVGHKDLLPEPVDLSDRLTVSDVCKEDIELQVVDLYVVQTESDETQKKGMKPFIHQVKLHGLKGEVVQVWGLFNNGAMVDAMSTETYNRIRHRLTPLGRSSQCLRMAHRNIVNMIGCWKGVVELGNTSPCPTDSCRNEPIPLESAGMSRNGQEWNRNGQEWHWNGLK